MPMERKTIEKLLRKAMFLPSEGPSPQEFRFVETENGYLEMQKLQEDEYRSQWAEWHSQPKRAFIAEKAARKLYGAELEAKSIMQYVREKEYKEIPVGEMLAQYLKPISKILEAKTERRLKAAKTLRVRSFYIHPPETDEFEGYIDLGEGITYPIHLASKEMISAYLSEDGAEATQLEPEIIFLPEEKLTPDNIQEAIGEWYTERYRFSGGHWTQPQGTRPRVELEVEFQEYAPEGTVRAIRAD